MIISSLITYIVRLHSTTPHRSEQICVGQESLGRDEEASCTEDAPLDQLNEMPTSELNQGLDYPKQARAVHQKTQNPIDQWQMLWATCPTDMNMETDPIDNFLTKEMLLASPFNPVFQHCLSGDLSPWPQQTPRFSIQDRTSDKEWA